MQPPTQGSISRMVWYNIGHLSTLIHEILLFANFFFKECPSCRCGDKPACGQRPDSPRAEGFRGVIEVVFSWAWVLGRWIWPGFGWISLVPLPPTRLPPQNASLPKRLPPLSCPFVAMSVPNTPASLDEATYKKGERMIIGHGTRKVCGELCRPFQADVLEVLKNVVVQDETVQIAYKVKRRDIPRRTSVVAHVNVFELRQYLSTPFSGEQRISCFRLRETALRGTRFPFCRSSGFGRPDGTLRKKWRVPATK